MADNEAAPEKDEPPASSNTDGSTTGQGNAHPIPAKAVTAPDSTSGPVSTNDGQNDNSMAKSAQLQGDLDEFGLPVKSRAEKHEAMPSEEYETASEDEKPFHSEDEGTAKQNNSSQAKESTAMDKQKHDYAPRLDTGMNGSSKEVPSSSSGSSKEPISPTTQEPSSHKSNARETGTSQDAEVPDHIGKTSNDNTRNSEDLAKRPAKDILHGHTGSISGWSHQALAPQKTEQVNSHEDEQWKTMPAYAPYDIYDDNNKLVAKEAPASDNEDANAANDAYHGLGGAGKGYTRVQLDEDARSTTSMDENTDYLFATKETTLLDDDEEVRDPLAQLQATKGLLTEGQRIAYVGVTRLSLAEMVKEVEKVESTRKTKKLLGIAFESAKVWSQQMMIRLYSHMEINTSEQLMIEQLTEHGLVAKDMTPALMQNARVKNPMAKEEEGADGDAANPKMSESASENRSLKSPKPITPPTPDRASSKSPVPPASHHEDNQIQASTVQEKGHIPPLKAANTEGTDSLDSLPAYDEHGNSMPEARSPTQLGTGEKIDIDIRWTVLCDLFLVLLSDASYDARSRTLLERVGKALEVSWVDICRFEKRAIEALEMEEAAQKETWDENEHMESRRKMALKRRYMMMGLATVGGSLVIGLSAGLLAPVIGAGLAAGFTTIGIAGTSGFLAGTAGTAIITSGSVVAGASMAIKATHRRTGAVGTFEYRPLHNNKRVNLIVTISGWMSGKEDDVRLPFSTIDPVMGDIYSVLWEPEMLRSTGQTINILATEALTQGLQHVLGSTILVALMASLQLPIVLSKLAYLIDNPWSVSMARANAAGLILADSLIDRNLGARPITLVGFSLGARVIFAALRELAAKGAFGLIQNVYLFGSPIVANQDEYLRARSVVSGRFVNAYASNDWILGYLFRATAGGIYRVSGLAAVESVAGIENIDVTKHISGHMGYRAAMPKLMRIVGWEVTSDEFTEIEEADPENHEKRQRELIKEIDEARKEAEKKPEKRRFGLFKRGKLAQKKGWETYDESSQDGKENDDFSTKAAEGGGGTILFDIEAIKRELHSEQIEVRQLESTLPPMKIDINGADKESTTSPLRATKSYNDSLPHQSSSSNEPEASSTRNNPFERGYDEYRISGESTRHHQASNDGASDFNDQHKEPTLSFAAGRDSSFKTSSVDLPSHTSSSRSPPPMDHHNTITSPPIYSPRSIMTSSTNPDSPDPSSSQYPPLADKSSSSRPPLLHSSVSSPNPSLQPPGLHQQPHSQDSHTDYNAWSHPGHDEEADEGADFAHERDGEVTLTF